MIWMIATGVIGLVAIWFLATAFFAIRENSRLQDYVLWLLLHEDIYKDHQSKLRDFANSVSAGSPSELKIRTERAIQNMANALCRNVGLNLPARAKLWAWREGKDQTQA